MDKRYQWLDVMKAFAIILVIFNHIEGLHIPLVTFLGGMVYMPVFFVSAGYTYRRKEGTYASFLLNKAKRLLVPYFVCNLLLFAFFTIKSGEFSETAFFGIFYSRTMLMDTQSAWNVALMPYLNAPTWFLTCMFLCYAFYELIERKFPERKRRVTAVAVVSLCGVALHYLSPVLLPWNLENAFYFLALLEFGRYLREEGEEKLNQKHRIYGLCLAGFLAFSYLNGTVNVSISLYGRSMLLYLAVAAFGTIAVMGLAKLVERYEKNAAKLFGWIGRHTLPILCWHLLAIEVIKTALRLAGLCG